jgi:hypothetical protein
MAVSGRFPLDEAVEHDLGAPDGEPGDLGPEGIEFGRTE